MVSKPATSSEIATALETLASDGVTALAPAQRRLLARVLVDEVQKGAFRLEPPEDQVLRFITHGREAFPADGDYKVVRDYRAKLQKHAEELSKESPPIASLILYATAIEHWLNSMIITASLRAGLTELDAQTIVKQFRFPDKVEWLQRRFGFPRFEEQRRGAMQQLVDRRNAYVHYKWKGVTQRELEAADKELHQIVDGASALLDYLEEFEFEQLAQPGIEAAIRIFAVERKDLSRRNFRRTP